MIYRLYTLDDMESILSTLKITTMEASRSACRTWWNFDNINSPFARLYYVDAGQGSVIHSNTTFPLLPGTVTIIQANTLGHYHCPKYMDLYWVHFNAKILESVDLFDFLACPLQIKISGKEREHVRTILAWHMHLFKMAPKGKNLAFDGIVRQIISLFVNKVNEQEQTIRMDRLNRFKPVFTYVHENPGKVCSLNELAKVMCLQPNYFSNLFCRHFGKPPLQYILGLRIEQAKNRLWNSDESLDTIGRAVGFCDAFHFSRSFKKLTGISPSEFRVQKRVLF